jgi:hypothetical protein
MKLGGEFAGIGVHCGDVNCGEPEDGACCVENMCFMIPEDVCFNEGGDWHGPGVLCEYVECDGGSMIGACCINGGCLMLHEDECASVLGTFDSTTHCEIVECPTSCEGDVNGDGLVDVTDVLAVVSAWGICP